MLKAVDAIEPEVAAFINTKVKPHIRIINGALDEDRTSPHAIVLNGRIDPSTLRFLKVDNAYQRPLGDRADIYAALKEGKVVPNIEIGIRGLDYEVDGDDILIHSPAYIIDGWQRVGTALRLLENVPNHPIRIFGSIHFGTDEIWERHRFTELNKNIKKVSANLHLRNMRDSNEAILTLFGLSHNDKTFPLYKRVCWSQAMQRGELLTALTLARAALVLHSQHSGLRNSSAESIAACLLRASSEVGLNRFRKNVNTMFSLVNECWPFAAIEYTRTAVQVKGSFLFELARMLSSHPVFWMDDDRTLFVSADDKRKLARFAIADPQVANLAGAGGSARKLLYRLMVDHMNSGRRTQRLQSRYERNA
jgi:hypothetical protein